MMPRIIAHSSRAMGIKSGRLRIIPCIPSWNWLIVSSPEGKLRNQMNNPALTNPGMASHYWKECFLLNRITREYSREMNIPRLKKFIATKICGWRLFIGKIPTNAPFRVATMLMIPKG